MKANMPRKPTQRSSASPKTAQNSRQMKPLFVHCHIFYPELWPALKDCLLNIRPYPFDLFVTMVTEHAAVRADILACFPKARVSIVENRGYDVGPFIWALKQVRLDDYSLVVKVHTKRDMPVGSLLGTVNVGGSRWRRYALSFLQTPQTVARCIKAFADDDRLGMVADARLILAKDTAPQSTKVARDLLQSVGLTPQRMDFVAGTMFMARAKMLAPLTKLKLSVADTPDGYHQQMGAAHAMERFLGGLVWAQGYRIADVFSRHPRVGPAWDIARKISLFLFKQKVDKHGRYSIRICRLPVFVRRPRPTSRNP